VIEFKSGNNMSLDLLTKNFPGPLFTKHSEHYVTSDEFLTVEDQQARESVGHEFVDTKIVTVKE
jgi:hypothetical protein